jgi:predicted RNA-binding Zn-ribbon protein involved in translation (DUF1610 family)
MKLSELRKITNFGINDVEVDPTSVIEHIFFENNNCNDYRTESVKHMIKKEIDFHSTCNSAYNVVKMFVKIVCPKCGSEMISNTGSGSSNSHTVNYECSECKTKVALTIPSDGFRVSFQKND